MHKFIQDLDLYLPVKDIMNQILIIFGAIDTKFSQTIQEDSKGKLMTYMQ